MSARDELVPRPPEELRNDIARWFEEYEEFYRSGPWQDLRRTRDRFETADRRTQEAMLTLSYVHTILTIQTKLRNAEEVYEVLVSGRKTIFHAMLDGSMYDKKANHIRQTLGGDADTEPMAAIEAAADALDRGDVEGALLALERDAEGIATRKAPFVLANLGYTSEMCLNLNVADVLNFDPDEFSFAEYQQACFKIEELFPDLSQRIEEPYHLQWVLFDYNRNKDVQWQENGTAVQLGLAGQKGKRVIVRPGMEDGPVDHASWFASVLDTTPQEMVDTVDLLREQSLAPMGDGPTGTGITVFQTGFGDPPERPSAAEMGFTARWFDTPLVDDDEDGDEDEGEQAGLLDF